MDPRSPRILVIYPYPAIDTIPFMAFLLESLAARRVGIDVLLEQSPQFVAPDRFGTSVHLEVMPSALADHQPVSNRNLLRRLAMKLLRLSRHRDYSLRFDPTIFGLRETTFPGPITCDGRWPSPAIGASCYIASR